jgi:hypothetical protein
MKKKWPFAPEISGIKIRRLLIPALPGPRFRVTSNFKIV